MKITFLNTFESYGGAAIAGKRLANSLKKNKVEVNNLVLYAGQIKSNESVVIANNYWKKKIALFKLMWEKGKFFFLEKSPEIRFQFSTNESGFNLARQKVIQNADIIHLHWFHQGMLSLKGLDRLLHLNKPVVWTLHDMWAFTGGCHYTSGCKNYFASCGNCPYLKNPNKDDISHQKFLAKESIYRKANLNIVTCSNWLANMAKESPLLGSLTITAIPNPIDTEQFKPMNKKAIRLELQLPVDKTIILFGAAKISDKRKGFKYLVHALKSLVNKYPDKSEEIVLLIFGSHDNKITSLLPFKTYTLGVINEPAKAYNAADVFVLPSLQDNLPNTILEAMSCGVPCLGFDVGGIPEMIDHKENGYIAKYKSDEDITNGLHWILTESNYRNLTENARQKVMDNYTEQVVADKYLTLYKDLLKGHE